MTPPPLLLPMVGPQAWRFSRLWRLRGLSLLLLRRVVYVRLLRRVLLLMVVGMRLPPRPSKRKFQVPTYSVRP